MKGKHDVDKVESKGKERPASSNGSRRQSLSKAGWLHAEPQKKCIDRAVCLSCLQEQLEAAVCLKAFPFPLPASDEASESLFFSSEITHAHAGHAPRLSHRPSTHHSRSTRAYRLLQERGQEKYIRRFRTAGCNRGVCTGLSECRSDTGENSKVTNQHTRRLSLAARRRGRAELLVGRDALIPFHGLKPNVDQQLECTFE